jgi:hypothetical protein
LAAPLPSALEAAPSQPPDPSNALASKKNAAKPPVDSKRFEPICITSP